MIIKERWEKELWVGLGVGEDIAANRVVSEVAAACDDVIGEVEIDMVVRMEDTSIDRVVVDLA